MPTQVLISRGDDAPTMSASELRTKLSDELELPCGAQGPEGDNHFVFDEVGISVTLALDEDTRPLAATIDIPHRARVTHVTRLFQAFTEWGWEF